MFFIKRAFRLFETQKIMCFIMLCLTFFCGHPGLSVSAQGATADRFEVNGGQSASMQFALYPDGRWSALHAGMGLGYVMHRDMGTAPISYRGPATGLNIGLWIDRPHWSIHIDLPFSVGAVDDAVGPMSFDALDVTVTPEAKILYAPQKAWSRYRYMVGGSITDRVYISGHPDYENAAVGVSNFVGINLVGRCERILKRHMIHGEATIMPVALITRPGYSYIGNPTADNNVANTFLPTYQTFAKAFATLRTDVGFDFLLRNGNRINLSYVWQYSSSGEKDIYRFDHAMHLLNVDFVFALRQKPIKK